MPDCERIERVAHTPGYTYAEVTCATHRGSGWINKYGMCHTAYWDAWANNRKKASR